MLMWRLVFVLSQVPTTECLADERNWLSHLNGDSWICVIEHRPISTTSGSNTSDNISASVFDKVSY